MVYTIQIIYIYINIISTVRKLMYSNISFILIVNILKVYIIIEIVQI